MGYGRRLTIFWLASFGTWAVVLTAYAALMVSAQQELPVLGLVTLSILWAIFTIVHVTKYGPTLRGWWLRPDSWMAKKLCKRRGAS